MAKKNSGSIDFPPQSAAKPAKERDAAQTPSPKVEHVATNFYGPESLDATPKEIRHKFRMTASRAENMIVADMYEQQERVKEVTKEYFAALRADQQSRGTGSKILEDLTGLEGNKKSTRDLRNEWLRARAYFAFTQNEALDERLRNRPKTREDILEGLKKYKGKESLDEGRVRARYERMVTVRTVVMGAEEAELAAKMEGLNSRDKRSIDRFYDRYKKLPPAVRIFGTSAALLGLTTGAGVILGGAMIGIVPLGMAGTSAALRFFAEKNNNKKVKQWLDGVSKFASIGGAFGALMNYGVTEAHSKLGTEERAQEILKKNERLGMLSNVNTLESISQKRKKSLVVRENIARQGRWARIAGSVGVGALFGQLFGHDSSTGENAELAASPDTSAGAPTPSSEEADLTTPDVLVEVVPGIEPFSATIDSGEGMSQLFVDLRTHYGEMYPDPTNPSVPPGIRHLLEAKDADSLSREFHFINENNTSYVMKVGDTLGFNENGSLVFTPKESPETVVTLLEKDVGGELRSHALTLDEQRGHFDARPLSSKPRVAVPLTETPEATVTESPNGKDATAQLNRNALQGEVVSSPEPVIEAPSLPVESTYESEVVTSASELPVEETPQVVVAPAAEGTYTPDLATETETLTQPVRQEPLTPLVQATPNLNEVHVASPTEGALEVAETIRPYYNSHRVEITPAVPSVYGVSGPDNTEILYVAGGQGEDSFMAAKVFSLEHPGVEVRYSAVHTDSVTGVKTPFTGAFITEEGRLQPIINNPETGRAFETIDSEEFTRRISFTYQRPQ